MNWHKYAKTLPQWRFGDNDSMANRLAQAVVNGKITATTSLFQSYSDNKPLPKAGQRSVIANASDEMVCVIENIAVDIYGFENVPVKHALNEGYQNLDEWYEEHVPFFKRCYPDFDPKTDKVVCETFKVVYLFE